jgi:hypothetical protein
VQAHTEQVQFARQQREIARLRAELAEAKRALPIEREYDAVLARLQCMPEGWVPVAAFTDGQEIVVIGYPLDEEADPTGELHDCDVMGCGVDHVLVRVAHPFALVAGKKPIQ